MNNNNFKNELNSAVDNFKKTLLAKSLVCGGQENAYNIVEKNYSYKDIEDKWQLMKKKHAIK